MTPKPKLGDVLIAMGSGPSDDETVIDETLRDSLEVLFPGVDHKDALRALVYVMRHCAAEE